MERKDVEMIWASVSAGIREQVLKTVYELWFSGTYLADLTSDCAVLSVETKLKKDIVSKRYSPLIRAQFEKVIGFDVDLVFVSRDEDEYKYRFDDEEDEEANEAADSKQNIGVFEENAQERTLTTPNRDTMGARCPHPSASLTPSPWGEGKIPDKASEAAAGEKGYKAPGAEYTFESFIVGGSNKFAHAASVAVANNPASVYNPLFIYGASGLGKTHLLYAIMNRIKSLSPALNVIYVKGEEFLNELVASIQGGTTPLFRQKYRCADVLLIDDIQFIAGKESVQEEFFHTFNSLYEDRKQIILAADRPPRDMKTLENRLKTRFEWGLIADIQLPDFELRTAIMRNKAARIGITIPNDVLHYLAENLRSNIRQLEGAVKRIGAQSFLNGAPITVELAKSCINDMLSCEDSPIVTAEKIISKVADKYGISIEDIKSRRKTKEIANARHICIYIIKTLTPLSYPAIGDIFLRDHSTVMASYTIIEDQMKISPLLEVEVNDIIREIKEE